MKKTVLFILLVICLVSVMILPAAAADWPLVCDEADLLTESEEAALLSRLESLSKAVGMDVVVVTVNSTEGLTPMAFADDFYDDMGYGQGANRDGVLLLISMEDNDWWISTCGYAITVFTDAGIEYIGKQVTPHISDGEYAAAFEEFAVQCEAFVAQAKTGDPYDSHNLPKEPFNVLVSIGIALVIGYVIAKFYTGGLKKQLKTVEKQAAAAEYVKKGSLNINNRSDFFLYRTVSKTARPSSRGGSSTHRSSSGTSHGGGGGKF